MQVFIVNASMICSLLLLFLIAGVHPRENHRATTSAGNAVSNIEMSAYSHVKTPQITVWEASNNFYSSLRRRCFVGETLTGFSC